MLVCRHAAGVPAMSAGRLCQEAVSSAHTVASPIAEFQSHTSSCAASSCRNAIGMSPLPSNALVVQHQTSNRMIAALSSNATCVRRDATGLPPPPAGRPNQEGQRGKPPRGPSDRQNRWAQDGPLDNVPPGKEQWGKPGNGMSFVLFPIC